MKRNARGTGDLKDNGKMEGGLEALEEKPFEAEPEKGLSFSWKDVLALTIAFMQIIFTKVVIVIASFALAIYILGKFWLKCW